AFTLPSGLMVVTSAIGRGTTRLARIGYARSANCPSRSSSMEEQLARFGTRVNSVSRARPMPVLRRNVVGTMRKKQQRQKLKAAPFPSHWSSILEDHFPLYARLPDED